MASLGRAAYTTLRLAGAGPAGASLGTLFVTITADATGLSRGLREAEKSLKASVGVMGSIAAGFAVAAAAAFAAVAAVAVSEYAKFEHEMVRASAIFGDVNKQMRAELEATARSLATQTNVSAVDLAKTYQVLASAGLSAGESQKALGIVTKFSIAGFVDQSKAVDYLVGAQNALGLASGTTAENMRNMTRVSDVLVKANQIAKGTVDDFAASLSNKAAVGLALTNKQIEEGVAVLAAMADRNIKGAHAGEQLYIALRDLQRIGVDSHAALAKYNVEIFDAGGNMRHLADIIGDLEKSFGGMSTAQRRAALEQIGFQDRSVASILALVGMSDKIREYEKALKSSSGTTDKMAKEVLSSFINQLTISWHIVQDILLSIGQGLLPALKELNTVFQKLADPNTGIGALVKPMAAIFGEYAVASIKASIALMKTFAQVALLNVEYILRGVDLVVAAFDTLKKVTASIPSWMSPALQVLRMVDTEEMGADITKSISLIGKLRDILANGLGADAAVEDLGNITKSTNALISSLTLAQVQAENTRQALLDMDALGVPKVATFLAGDKAGLPRDLTKAEKAANLQMEGVSGQLAANAKEIDTAKQRLEFLKSLDGEEIEMTEELYKRKEQAMEYYNKRAKQLTLANASMITSSWETAFSDVAAVTAGFAGKQSGIYKAMFATSKAFAIAVSTIKIFQGVAEAASLPWPANLAAIASVISATAGIISSIQSVNLEFGGGKARGGRVSPNRMYMVGERGPEPFIPSTSGTILPNERIGGGETNVVVHNYSGERAEVRERDDNGVKMVEVFIGRMEKKIAGNIRSGEGDISKAIEGAYKVRRG